MSKRKGSVKKELILFLTGCILVFAAVVGGYIFSKNLADSIVNGSDVEQNSEVRSSRDEATGENTLTAGNENDTSDENNQTGVESKQTENTDEDYEQPLSDSLVPLTMDMHPINVVFLYDDTEAVKDIKIEFLDCVKLVMVNIHIPGNVSYTMSSDLYKKLSAANVTVPQTVTFTELYHYYDDERAYEAGLDIINEMLGTDAGYYTATEAEYYFSDYGNADFETVAEKTEEMLDESVTNWSEAERVRYTTVYASMRPCDVSFFEAPVIVKNENSQVDVSRTIAILYQSGFYEEE